MFLKYNSSLSFDELRLLTLICHRSLPSEAELSKFRKFKLQFEGQLPRKLYTGNNIEAEGSLPLKIVLLDAQSGEVVMHGPLSSAKVKIVVLHGHFKDEMPEGWTQKKFNDSIVLARAGKGRLLFGERVIPLCNGIGFVKGISFTDNSSWVRSKMFRLGAKVKPKAKEDEVREAVSSPFEVKHRRGASKYFAYLLYVRHCQHYVRYGQLVGLLMIASLLPGMRVLNLDLPKHPWLLLYFRWSMEGKDKDLPFDNFTGSLVCLGD